MPDIAIHNETDYDLTALVLDQIKRDACEYFGESVHSIRIQYGIERHAFNAKTGEVRYAFSPSDYGLLDTMSIPEAYPLGLNVPTIDDDTEEIDDTDFEGLDVDDDDAEASFDSVDVTLSSAEDDDGPQFKSLDTDFESIEDTESDFLYDDDYN
jgi:hypothetical protein